jgi:hypothetical protein
MNVSSIEVSCDACVPRFSASVTKTRLELLEDNDTLFYQRIGIGTDAYMNTVHSPGIVVNARFQIGHGIGDAIFHAECLENFS